MGDTRSRAELVEQLEEFSGVLSSVISASIMAGNSTAKCLAHLRRHFKK